MRNTAILEAIRATTLKSEWKKMFQERAYLHDRLVDYAGWTIPNLFLETGDDSDTSPMEQQHDYQSLGAQLVNHLSNKVATVLFQPGKPFFRLSLTDQQILELVDTGMKETDIDELLSKAEKAGMKELAKAKIRTSVLQVIKSLIVLGNSLLYFPDGKSNTLTSQVYSLKDYVIKRDMSGAMTKLITRDTHSIASLPTDILEVVQKHDSHLESDDEVTLYTAIMRTDSDTFMVWQEIEDIMRVPRQIGKYAERDLPWIPLTWNLSRGHSYGTGLVEEYAGDFHTYSSMAEAMVNLSALASDIKILIDPMGSTDVDALNESESGTYVYGNADDISYLQLEKLQDARFIIEQMEIYARRLGAGFLFNSAVTRTAERVTAEEIRMQANELEGSLGGVYSRLSEDMQLPIARKTMANVGEEFKNVEPTIVTGVESLSRTSELDQIMLFFADLARLADLPPEAAKRLNYQGIISKLGAARQVDYKDFLVDEDTVKANDRAAAALEAKTASAGKAPPQQQEQVI